MDMGATPIENNQMDEINNNQQIQEELEDMNQDIDVQQPGATNVQSTNTQWDDDDF